MEKLVPLESEAGQRMLKEAASSSLYQPFLHATFSKQIGRSNCGIQTCALLVGAAELGRSRPEPPQLGTTIEAPQTEEAMMQRVEQLQVTRRDVVAAEGLDLQSMATILLALGLQVEMKLASTTSVDRFRTSALEALRCNDSRRGVFVNYLMSTLGQGENFGGHHSPLAAYHQESDRFLLLDTWPDTRECWARAEDLFNAMNTLDNASGLTRGYCLVHF